MSKISNFYIKPSEVGIICGVNKWKKIIDIIENYLSQSKLYKNVKNSLQNNLEIGKIREMVKNKTDKFNDTELYLKETDKIIKKIKNTSLSSQLIDNMHESSINNDIMRMMKSKEHDKRMKEIVIEEIIKDTSNYVSNNMLTTNMNDVNDKLKKTNSYKDVDHNKRIINDVKFDGLKNELSGKINTSFGINNEKKVIELYENTLNIEVYIPDKIISSTIEGVRFRGICDGIVVGLSDECDDNSHIIEVKCRMNRLFDYIPKYEIYQCQCYMIMYDYDICDLVQFYKNNYKITKIKKDENLFVEIIIPKLLKFLSLLNDITLNKESCGKFYMMTRKEKIKKIEESMN